MKKLFLPVCLALIVALSAQAQQKQIYEPSQQVYVNSQDSALLPNDSLGVHPWNGHQNDIHYVIPNPSHWSIWLEAGMNIFDGDYTSEQKSIVALPTVGAGVHYHWNNTWGMGAEYKFRRYHVNGKDEDCYPDVMLNGMAHQADAFLSFDVFNAFRPQNKRKIFALDLIVGGGAIWTKSNIFYPATDKNGHNKNEFLAVKSKYDEIANTYMSTYMQEKHEDGKYLPMGVFMGGISAEFNINRFFELGLRCMYNYTTKDEPIDGRTCGDNNDGFFDCDLLLRWKIVPREKSNVRNFMVDETIDRWNDGDYYEDPAIGAAKRAKAHPKDTEVPDTIFVIHKDTVFMVPQDRSAEPFKRIRDYVVYFENDKYNIDNVALSTINEAAVTLAEYPNYMAVVVGSCDNTGAVQYNKWLAVQRANMVTNTLQDLGIDSTRIYIVGRGIMQDDREEGEYGPNRRVEIRIVDAEGMENARDMFRRFEANKYVKRTSATRQKGEGVGASSSKIMTDPFEIIEKVIPQQQ